MAIQESGEMYLESIYILSQQQETVHSVDVGRYMNFSKPSVCRAVGLLKNSGYITVDDDGHIWLTDAGKEIAQRTYMRHTLLTEWFLSLGVPADIAAADACKIEHVISEETFEAIKKHASEKK